MALFGNADLVLIGNVSMAPVGKHEGVPDPRPPTNIPTGYNFGTVPMAMELCALVFVRPYSKANLTSNALLIIIRMLGWS